MSLPKGLAARLDAANLLLASDQRREAVQLLLGVPPEHWADPRYRHALAAALEGYALGSAEPGTRKLLLEICLDEDIATQNLADAVMGLARNSAEFPVLLEAAVVGWDPLDFDIAEIIAFLRDPLLRAVLCRAVASDPSVERVLTHLRRCMLLHADAESVTFAFACALAQQCANVEYAYYESADEIELLDQLRRRIGDALGKAAPASPAIERQLVIAALYAPLHRLPHWESLLDWPPEILSDDFRPLWREQVWQHRQEAEIAERIEALTPIRNEISRAVHAQYEENPYPRWTALPRLRVRTLAEVVPDFTGHSADGSPRRGSILVAGGGTGRHPIFTALSFPDCEVVAVDLSRASLAFAMRMADRLGARNLRFWQADILELAAAGMRFDMVESAGVLHHLQDPLAGWRVLAGLLHDHGAMMIALYSEIARRPLRAAREFIREGGYPPTADGIRRCRRAMLDLPEGHPARSALSSDDFYSLSGFRDLVMHVQEHAFTLPAIADILRELGLQFHGFLCPAALQARYQASRPDPAALTDLLQWHEFEEKHPDSFRAMYQFLCGRSNAGGSAGTAPLAA